MTDLLLAGIACLLALNVGSLWWLAQHFEALLESHHCEASDAGVMQPGSGRALLRDRIIARRKQMRNRAS